jgi:hypothetical protein
MAAVSMGAILIPSTLALAEETSIDKNQFITKEEASTKEDGLLYVVDNPFESQVTTMQVIADGGWSWKQINKRNSDTKLDEKFVAFVGNTVYNIAVAFFGAKLIKGALSVGEFTGAVTSGFIASVKKPIKL